MKVKYSLLFIGVVIFYMFYEWYGTNPLRVVLMFFSCSVGYVMVIICSVIMKYLGKNNTAKSNKEYFTFMKVKYSLLFIGVVIFYMFYE